MQRTFYIKTPERYEFWKQKAALREMSISAYIDWLIEKDNFEKTITDILFKKRK